MTRDPVDHASAELDMLLSLWHAWQQGDRGVRGFNHKALVIGDTRAMRVQYEAQLERQDDEHDALKCKAVEFAVAGDGKGNGGLEQPYRTAIYINARNLATGRDVWMSPRLPADRDERARILFCARVQLVRKLQFAGVM